MMDKSTLLLTLVCLLEIIQLLPVVCTCQYSWKAFPLQDPVFALCLLRLVASHLIHLVIAFVSGNQQTSM